MPRHRNAHARPLAWVLACAFVVQLLAAAVMPARATGQVRTLVLEMCSHRGAPPVELTLELDGASDPAYPGEHADCGQCGPCCGLPALGGVPPVPAVPALAEYAPREMPGVADPVALVTVGGGGARAPPVAA